MRSKKCIVPDFWGHYFQTTCADNYLGKNLPELCHSRKFGDLQPSQTTTVTGCWNFKHFWCSPSSPWGRWTYEPILTSRFFNWVWKLRFHQLEHTLPETNTEPENWSVEKEEFLLANPPIFRCENVSFREGNINQIYIVNSVWSFFSVCLKAGAPNFLLGGSASPTITPHGAPFFLVEIVGPSRHQDERWHPESVLLAALLDLS